MWIVSQFLYFFIGKFVFPCIQSLAKFYLAASLESVSFRQFCFYCHHPSWDHSYFYQLPRPVSMSGVGSHQTCPAQTPPTPCEAREGLFPRHSSGGYLWAAMWLHLRAVPGHDHMICGQLIRMCWWLFQEWCLESRCYIRVTECTNGGFCNQKS